MRVNPISLSPSVNPLRRHFSAHEQRRPDIGRLESETDEITRRHADDREALAVKAQRPAHDLRVACEMSLPEVVAQDHDGILPRRAVLFRCESSTEAEARSQFRKEVVGNEHYENPLRFRRLIVQQEDITVRGDQSGVGPGVVTEVNVVREGIAPLAPWFRSPVFETNYRVRVFDLQRAQEDVEDGKDGCVDADAQRQREHDHGGEAGPLAQRSQAIAQVLPKVRSHIAPPVRAHRNRFLLDRALDPQQFARQRTALTQLRERRAISLIRRSALGERLRVAILQVLREFLDYLGLARRRKLQVRQPLSDLFLPLRHSQSFPWSPAEFGLAVIARGFIHHATSAAALYAPLLLVLGRRPLVFALIGIPNDFAYASHLRRGLKGSAVDSFVGLTFPGVFTFKRHLIAPHDAGHLFLWLAACDCEIFALLFEDKGDGL